MAVTLSEAEYVADQVWPGLTAPNFRVSVDAPSGFATGNDWHVVERFVTLGRKGRTDILVSVPRRAAARGLASYSRLRSVRKRIERIGASVGVLLGLVRPSGSISLLVKSGANDRTETVLEQLRNTLGQPVGAVTHVRRTANRKALLQVLDWRGRTIGFAKVARNALSAEGIESEIAALEQFEGGSPSLSVPRVLAKGRSAGMPFVLTEPLPRDIRGLTSRLVDAPSAVEFAELAPVVRWGPPSQSGHFKRIRARVAALSNERNSSAQRARLEDLLRLIDSVDQSMPIAKWWHGDFAFWNAGRTPNGTLWCWDFENVEEDALAGLDVIHWHASRKRETLGARGLEDRRGILDDSGSVLRVLGVGRKESLLALYRVYIAEIAVRTFEMVAADGWDRVWCSVDELERILAAALAD